MVKRKLSELIRQNRTDHEIYHELIQARVREILLVASIYDAFILEEEDKLTEKIFGEYYQLNLSNAPRITSVTFAEEALEMLERRSFDMVILTMRIDGVSPFELAKRIKDITPSIPILLLLNDNTEIGLLAERKDLHRDLDKIFVWNGDSKIFLAMIKYIEDKLNVVKDTKIGLVRVILLVEDSIRYYSSYLPTLYTEIMKQTQRIIADEHLDEMKKLLRMRTRPKVLMAESYEEAIEIIDEYSDYMLCLISDISFPREGKKDPQAGVQLVEYCRNVVGDIPILIQSSDPDNEAVTKSLRVSFLNKNSESLSRDLTEFILKKLGFGDFVFRNEKGKEIGRAQTMGDLEHLLSTVPDESLVYHASRNHFSGWLMARGEIQMAKNIQPIQFSDFPSCAVFREHLIEVFQKVQDSKIRGRVVYYDPSLIREESRVLRLGEGSLGGKGRGMAFLHMLTQNFEFTDIGSDVHVKIPRTAIIGTEEYDWFVEKNGLSDLFLYEDDYGEVKKRFLKAQLSVGLRSRLARFIEYARVPLSVRSSGMFEDSLSQPFSGIYDTYLLPNNHPDSAVRLRQLDEAVKLVYVSVCSKRAKAYFDAINYKVGEEKMAVLIQGIVGRQYGNRYYPHIAGVVQSYNYYPVAYLKPEDGIAVVGYGLGKHVIDGEKSHRFCPLYPKLDFVTPEEQLESSQESFFALDLTKNDGSLAHGDDTTLVRLPITEAVGDRMFHFCVSTWDQLNSRLQAGTAVNGPIVVNFAHVLKYGYFPLAQVLGQLLEIVKGAMGTPVEIEFAVDLEPESDGRPTFYVLQIKPLLGNLEEYSLELEELKKEDLLLYTEHSVGNGKVDGLSDLIFVDLDNWDRSKTVEMRQELELLNGMMKKEGRKYVLVGPGRWGSSDRWLGIPVDWSHISNAKIIVEVELSDFHVDPSLGSHFFHNVTSMNIGYFDISYRSGSDFIDWEWLKSRNAVNKTEHFVHVRTETPLVAKMDGRKSVSVVYKSAT
jgi:CheY-like chemotaxis protein